VVSDDGATTRAASEPTHTAGRSEDRKGNRCSANLLHQYSIESLLFGCGKGKEITRCAMAPASVHPARAMPFRL
jgi:hypothetical protein